jgi:protocatechuate 3,4-dioxygenase beta subunit
MNERLLWLLLFMIVPGRAATLTQVAAPPVTQTSPGVPAGPTQKGSGTGPRDNEQKSDTGTGRIAGRVIGGENGAPLRRAIVSLWGEGMREGRSATTDEAGRFEFKELPAARFNLNASKAGYVTMRYGQRRAFEAGSRSLHLADGQSVTNVQFNLPRGGVITGRITDEFGEPIAGISVKILKHQYAEGRRQLMPVMGGWASTDDLGQYRAYGLAAGEYFVSASTGGGAGPFGAPSDDRGGFAPTYYPGTPTVADARQVPVRAGTEVTASFALLPARTLTISGTAVDSEGKPVVHGFVMVQEGPAGRQAMFTMNAGGMIRADGTFTIANLTPGEYVLHVNTDRGMEADSESAAVPVTLGTEDVSGLAIVTTRPATIAGQVILDGGQGASLQPAELNFFVVPVEPVSPMFGRPITPKDDWTFEGTARESPALIRGGEQAAGWRIKAVLQRGVDVTDTGVVFRPGERVDDVQITLSNRLSVVTGSAAGDGGGPAKDYVVVVFADDPQRWGPASRHIASARPDQQGQFEVKGLPPGDYLALAVEYLEEGQDRDPEFLLDMRPSATSFALGEGERKALLLKIVRRD